jgi:DNA-binding NarL/FixJ family response regulator
MIRIVIADGDVANRERLRRLLGKHAEWQVCGEASTGPQAVELTLRVSPHVAILDLALPEMNGLEAVRRIKKMRPDTEVLVLTAHETEDLVRDLLIAGGKACLAKSATSDQIAAAVNSLAQHRPFLSPTAMHAVLDVFLTHRGQEDRTERPYLLLTPRECEILQLLAEGHSNLDISRLLTLRVKTVATHRATIMKKLGVRSLAELVRYAIRERVIDNA